MWKWANSNVKEMRTGVEMEVQLGDWESEVGKGYGEKKTTKGVIGYKTGGKRGR